MKKLKGLALKSLDRCNMLQSHEDVFTARMYQNHCAGTCKAAKIEHDTSELGGRLGDLTTASPPSLEAAII